MSGWINVATKLPPEGQVVEVHNNGGSFIGRATRCAHCGARKCDHSGCQSRRHHQDAHIYASGRVEAVGG